jgi:hypothetical protein
MSEEVEVGTCALCGQEMIRTADDCWHPYDVATACPPEPGPMTESRENFNAWQEFYASGLRPGRPGREHFTAAKETA